MFTVYEIDVCICNGITHIKLYIIVGWARKAMGIGMKNFFEMATQVVDDLFVCFWLNLERESFVGTFFTLA